MSKAPVRKSSRSSIKPAYRWGVVLILAAIVLFAVYYFFIRDTKPEHQNIPTTPFDTSTLEQKQQDAAANATKKQQVAEKNGGQPVDTPAADNSSTSISLSAKQESNGSVTVFTKLYGYSSGSCSISVTNGSARNNQTAAVIYAPEYSSCAGFSVPITSLGAGDWSISLKVDSNGASATKSINFKVM